MFDANSADVFYAEQQTDTTAGRNSGMFVAPGMHAILFKENPQTTEDSLAIYVATDAGVYVFGKDATQTYSWQAANKGLKSSQYYNVAAAADGGAAAEEKTDFNVELTEVGPNKVKVIKVVREVTGLGLKEAKEVVDGAPKIVKEGAEKAEAEDIKAKLEAEGAKVTLKYFDRYQSLVLV